MPKLISIYLNDDLVKRLDKAMEQTQESQYRVTMTAFSIGIDQMLKTEEPKPEKSLYERLKEGDKKP